MFYPPSIGNQATGLVDKKQETLNLHKKAGNFRSCGYKNKVVPILDFILYFTIDFLDIFIRVE